MELTFLLPMLAGLAAFFLPVRLGRLALLSTGPLHLTLSAMAWLHLLPPYFAAYFAPTPIGMLVLMTTSFLFVLISIYTATYLAETHMHNEPVFIAAMLLFLAAMSMVAIADHIIVIWIAIEATTLASAPLILLHKSKGALEATWKYVLICSVGIALALLGSFFLVLSMEKGGISVPLTFSALMPVAGRLNPVWLKAGFIFILIGYGTKMGLAPMHTWLPDAHSEAPSPASALLSGALLNCAFLGIFKTHTLLYAAGLGEYSGAILMAFGLVSMLVAATFILNQYDYKRMLAYSSIENMGIVAFGIGCGGLATYGAILHLIHHSLLKSSLFLTAGNLLLGYSTKLISRVGHMIKLQPKTFVAFFCGFIGVSGLPPFGLFISELFIILGAFRNGRYPAVAIFILSLVLIFAGASRNFLRMSFAGRDTEMLLGERNLRVLPSYLLLLTSVALTIWLPPELYHTIAAAIGAIGGAVHG